MTCRIKSSGMDTKDSIVIPTPSPEELKPKFNYMENVIRISSIINMWPNTKKTNSFRYNLVVWSVTLMCASYLISCTLQIVKEYKNVDSIAFRVAPLMGSASAAFHYFYVYVRGEKYSNLVSLMQKNFIHYSLFPKKNRGCILEHYKSANKLVFGYGIFTVVWIFQMCAMPLVGFLWRISTSSSGANATLTETIEYPLVLKVYAPFDYEKQPANTIFYMYTFITAVFLSWLYVLYDCFFYMVIFMTIAQFTLLKDSLSTIAEVLGKDSSVDDFRPLEKNEIQQVEDGLKHCIRLHQTLREFIGALDDLNSVNVLVDSVHGVLSVGFVLLEMTVALNVGDKNRLQHSLEYFSSMLIHVFLFNWLGNELTSKEEELVEAIQEIPWYRCPKLNPLLAVMSMQARRPCKLSGGKLYTLSLDFFTTVMQAAFSYFTFFLQFRNPAVEN